MVIFGKNGIYQSFNLTISINQYDKIDIKLILEMHGNLW